MASGRYRSEMLCRHWSDNRTGYCAATTCHLTPGTLEHLLAVCPALKFVRERLYQMWLEKSVMFPTLHSTIRDILDSSPATQAQFILEPLAFPQIFSMYQFHGQHFLNHPSYLTRTFAFYIHREKQILVGKWHGRDLPKQPLLTNNTKNNKTNSYSISVHPTFPVCYRTSPEPNVPTLSSDDLSHSPPIPPVQYLPQHSHTSPGPAMGHLVCPVGTGECAQHGVLCGVGADPVQDILHL